MTKFIHLWMVPLVLAPSATALAFLPRRHFVTRAVTATVVGWNLASGKAQATNVATGAKVFDSLCAACHVGGQNVFAKEKTLEKEALERFLGLDNVLPYLQSGIVHRGVLSFGGKLSDQNFKDVTAYVVEQATENKW